CGEGKGGFGKSSPIWALDWSKDGGALASGDARGIVRVWDVKSSSSSSSSSQKEKGKVSGEMIGAWSTKDTPVYEVKWSPRNLLMVAGAYRPTAPPSKGGKERVD
ncbi:hypothetical protein BJ684DRAFT_18021, partial [Piptocephalis cylindrospora]